MILPCLFHSLLPPWIKLTCTIQALFHSIRSAQRDSAHAQPLCMQRTKSVYYLTISHYIWFLQCRCPEFCSLMIICDLTSQAVSRYSHLLPFPAYHPVLQGASVLSQFSLSWIFHRLSFYNAAAISKSSFKTIQTLCRRRCSEWCLTERDLFPFILQHIDWKVFRDRVQHLQTNRIVCSSICIYGASQK